MQAAEAPVFKLIRYDESYAYLRDPSQRSDYLDAIKFIPLTTNGDWYLTLGGEIREARCPCQPAQTFLAVLNAILESISCCASDAAGSNPLRFCCRYFWVAYRKSTCRDSMP